MAVKMIVGLQYGDEGKGRATHYEAKNASVVIRATGGCNAGHTVVANGNKYAMHLLPSSIIRPEVLSMIGPGVVVDLKVLAEEIQDMKNAGVKMEKENFAISERAHITLPHHKQLDQIYELMKSEPIGTTGRGVGPTYEEKARRTNIRMVDLLLDDAALKQKILENLKVYNALVVQANISLDKSTNGEPFPIITVEEEFQYCRQYRESLKPYIVDTQIILADEIEKENQIIIEGAQSFWLDNDYGDYPMTTSSNPNASGTASGAGIGPTLIDEVIGVMKAYTSRVGNGPFVTEQDNEIGSMIRELGHEYGTTTGRERRCGWLDLVMIKSTKVPSGLTGLCINHLDTIGKFDIIRVCYAYKHKTKGYILHHVPIDPENYEPIYYNFEGGWNTDDCNTFDDLPETAKAYLQYIEDYVGVPIRYIGVGADEKRTIIK